MAAPRMSAEERRVEVLAAAAPLVAARGFEATPTSAIAEAAGISHAYLFRLFPSKQDLAVALVERCNRVIYQRFSHAVEQARGTDVDPMDAMGLAYGDLVADRETLLLQLHAHAASPTHPEIRAAMQESFRVLYELVERATGAPSEELRKFFAHGMLMNVAAALDFDTVGQPWATSLACWADDVPQPPETTPAP